MLRRSDGCHPVLLWRIQPENKANNQTDASCSVFAAFKCSVAYYALRPLLILSRSLLSTPVKPFRDIFFSALMVSK